MIIYQVNDLNPILYDSMSDVIEENFQTALKYVDYEQRIVDYITKVFTENNNMRKKVWYAPYKFESFGEAEIKAVEESLRDGWLAGFGP
jgi:hypothetical protein